MSKLIVYVEGKSDILAMETIFASLIEHKRSQGISIGFFEIPQGNRKKAVALKAPVRAAHIICNKPDTYVAAIPDYYPPIREINHDSPETMKAAIKEIYIGEMKRLCGNIPTGAEDRFRVFCFKHDMEALILAAHESLSEYLKPCSPASFGSWKMPVEDQNMGNPPKRVVERLFEACSKRYVGTTDAPDILSYVDYTTLSGRCSQEFKPFADFLESL